MIGSLDHTLGAIEMGAFVSAILYGMMSIQAYMYSIGCKSERVWIKLLVTVVWCVLR
jgi:hypothetical protein